MTRARNRLGLPELSTPEAFVLWLVLFVVLSALAYAVGLRHGWEGLGLVVSLVLIMLTPKKRKAR
jgi:hypothetical protein